MGLSVRPVDNERQRSYFSRDQELRKMNASTLRGSSKSLCDAKRQRRNFTSSTTLRVADSSSRIVSVAAHAQGPRKRSVGDIATNGCEAETSLKRREALNWGMMVASASYLK